MDVERWKEGATRRNDPPHPNPPLFLHPPPTQQDMVVRGAPALAVAAALALAVETAAKVAQFADAAATAAHVRERAAYLETR